MHHQNLKHLLEKVLKKMKNLKKKVRVKTTMMIERKWLVRKGTFTKCKVATKKDNKQTTKKLQTASRYRQNMFNVNLNMGNNS
jgi:hypothetical protein